MAWGEGGRPGRGGQPGSGMDLKAESREEAGPGSGGPGVQGPSGVGLLERGLCSQGSRPGLGLAPTSSATHQSRCFGVTSSSVALMLLLRVGGRDCKTSGQSQPGPGRPRRLYFFQPHLSTPSHPPTAQLWRGMRPVTQLSPPQAPGTGHRGSAPGPPRSSPFPLSPVSSSRKALQRLASRGSRTQLPTPATHSSRRLCAARPSSTLLRSCRGMARVGCSQPAGGPLWTQ